jgi:hypothetical protein
VSRPIICTFVLYSVSASWLALCPVVSAQGQAIGSVQVSDKAHIGRISVTPGSTIYAGEVVDTDDGGAVQLRVATSRFGLGERSSASFYSRQNLAMAQLLSGKLVFSKDSKTENLLILASDVKIVPKTDGPIAGEVSIVSACRINVTSRLGELEVTSGNEVRTIAEKQSYSVRPEVTVVDVDSHVFPDDVDYHRSHHHSSCAAVRKSGVPVAAAQSHFLLFALATAGVVAGVGIKLALESPSIP